MDDESKKVINKKPLRFHTPGVRWRYSDGALLEIDKDGVARRPEPRVRQSKKARKKFRHPGGGK